MYKETEAMKDVHRIQEKIYDETKNMSVRDELDYIRRNSREVQEIYGFTLKKAMPAQGK